MKIKKIASRLERKKKSNIDEVLLKEELYAEKIISIIRLIIFSVFFVRHIVIIIKVPELDWSNMWAPSVALFLSIGILIEVWFWGKEKFYKYYNRRVKYIYATMDIVTISYFITSNSSEIGFSNHILTPVSTMATILFMALFIFFIILSIFRFNPGITLYTGIISLVAYVASFLYLYQPESIIEIVLYNGRFRPAGLAFFPVITTVTILSSLLSHRLKTVLVKSKKQDDLQRFLPDFITNDILNGNKDISMGGNLYTATILFSDIRNFTSMSENQKPEEVVDFLNTYMNDMIEIIFRYEGVLDKIIGDGIMAIFGAPFYNEHAAKNAVRTAIDMNRKLEDFNSIRALHKLDPIRIGIGIHTGPVVMGNIGSMKRMEYTAIGDAVNTASRLESYTKEANTGIVISENTLKHLDESISTQSLGEINFKGKKQSVKTYKVIY